jgi:CDP-glucose 4,6-dehydratase
MNRLFNNFYKNKKVLVTGHTGFKGSWLAIWLKELGAEIIGYSLEPYNKLDNFNLTHLNEKMIHIIGDVRKYNHLFDVFKEYEPEIVFHLAAQSLVGDSYKNPKYTYDTNIGGTVNFLDCIRNTKSTKIGIIITSDKCYENKEWMWGYKELDSLGGYDPYSSSKACCEMITSAYVNSFFNSNDYKGKEKEISTFRAGNVIGGGDWRTNRLIPDCIKAIKSGEKLNIRNPNAIRPWQHVLDPLGGYLLLAYKMFKNENKYLGAWNFGPKEHSFLTVKEIIEKVIKCWNFNNWEEIINLNKQNYHETKLLKLDITKAMIKLNWKPVLNINEAIKFTVDWYKEHNPDYNYDSNQINEFISIAKRKKIDWCFE